MKISKNKLEQIIKEEIENFLSEHGDVEIEEGVGYIIIINGEPSDKHYDDEARKLLPLMSTLKASGIEDVEVKKAPEEIERAYHPGDLRE